MIRTESLMGTTVTIHVVDRGADERRALAATDAIERAFGWFRHVEACCTRFNTGSELMRLCSRVGEPVPVSATLCEAVRFALAVAHESGGTFDPTIGGAMEARGFNRDYRTGQVVRAGLPPTEAVTYRDVSVDPDRRTITLLRALTIDLGAVVKGLAIDMAARELRAIENYAIDAGGDMYVAGFGPDGGPWSVGIRHPRLDGHLLDVVHVSNMAVCTSGDYERVIDRDAKSHHILDPRTLASVDAVASVTVVAPTAMVADALSTAAFVLGPAAGLALLEAQGVEGLIVTPSVESYATKRFFHSALFPNAEGPADRRPHGDGRRRRAG